MLELRFSLHTSKPVGFLVVIGRHTLLIVDKNIFVYAYDARDLICVPPGRSSQARVTTL